MNNSKIKKVVVSACLLGVPCRYDGNAKPCKKVIDFLEDKQVFEVCPEVMGGLETPRTPAEIIGDRVITSLGKDVSCEYFKGAEKTLEIAKANGVHLCILKSRSPSCGVGQIYDGSFSAKLKAGNGCTAGLLLQNGFEVITEEDL